MGNVKMATYTQGIGAAPKENEAEELKSLQTTSLCQSNAKYTPKALLTFNKGGKNKLEMFNFGYPLFSSFFLLSQAQLEKYSLCEY